MTKKHHNKHVTHHHVEEDTTYVKIDEALMTRKKILESAVQMAELMKRYESFKILRELKMREMKKLELLVKKIKVEINAYTKSIPKIKEVVEEEKKELKMLHKMEMHRGTMPVVAQEKTQLSGIDREIEEIKARLNELHF